MTQSSAVFDQLRQREANRNPIRVALVGAGSTGRAIALQLGTPVPGIRLAGIVNRTPAHAERALREAGFTEWRIVENASLAATAIDNGLPVLTTDFRNLTRCETVEVIVDATGTVDFGAQVVLDAIAHGKHVVLVNAELDSLLGPLLKSKADQAGVVYTYTDGDEPGVAMTLLRYLQTLGLEPVAAGNIKGMVDYYRTPDTQREYARKFDQDLFKVTSFADSTKLSMETCVLANATGFGVGKRGMFGPKCGYVRDLANLLPADAMLAGGIVDYSIGAAPHTGAFVIVHEVNARKKSLLSYYKLGDGPFYVFYTPFHLAHLQLASTIGRAVLHQDATVAPVAGPRCEVLTIAKRSLKAGEKLDGIGGFCSYGLIDNVSVARAIDALPIALSDGCELLRDVAKDAVISRADVRMPAPQLADRLWLEQLQLWPVSQLLPASIGAAPPTRSSHISRQ